MSTNNKKKNTGFTPTPQHGVMSCVFLNIVRSFRFFTTSKILHSNIRRHKKTTPRLVSGFTLIETLVAISILLMSISAPLTIASRGLASSFFARDQVIAFYLAQDAVEYIHNARDNNVLSDANWLNGLPDTSGELFTVDTTDGTMSLCPGGGCAVLNYNDLTGFYGHTDLSGSPSIFTRSVSVQTINANEVIISVTISWSAGTFSRSFSVKENILNWQ